MCIRDSIELLPYHRTGADKDRRLGREYGMGETASLTETGITGIKEYLDVYKRQKRLIFTSPSL